MKSSQSLAIAVTSLSTLSSSAPAAAFQPSIISKTSTFESSYLPLSSSENYRNPASRILLPSSKSSTSRLYSSWKDPSENDDSIVKKAGKKLKSFLPKFLGGKEDEAQLAKKQAKSEISSGINTMLKDAPLGLRMIGKMAAPIIGSVVGQMASAMKEQSRQVGDALEDAKSFIVRDETACRLLGEPISVDPPFSQSSSSMSVNGQSSMTIQAQFQVQGSMVAGVATMEARDGEIVGLTLNVNGRNISIDVSGKGTKVSVVGSTSGVGKNRKKSKDDDIIDVEFCDKVQK